MIPCGPVANESEQRGIATLKDRLVSTAGDDKWILLTNLVFSVSHQLQSDEIDIVAIGPAGVRVIEIKHWTAQWIDEHPGLVEQHAENVASKAKKIGTTLRGTLPDLDYVDGVILLTQEAARVKKAAGKTVRNVTFYPLTDWKGVIGFDRPAALSHQQIQQAAIRLQPRSSVAIDGSLRRLAGYVNLELQTPKEDRFHRVYKGNHPARRDKVVLHLYDLSGSDDKKAEEKARREFDALHLLQIFPWAPRVLDSYQAAPGYEGEMFFYTLVDPAAPSIEERDVDQAWKPEDRLAFARKCIQSLHQLHNEVSPDVPLLHRNLTPRAILVKHDNTPILTGFEYASLPEAITVASSSLPSGLDAKYIAPEVRSSGRSAADLRSDVYALCASLSLLFRQSKDDLNQAALAVLQRGQLTEPAKRASLPQLETAIAELLGQATGVVAPPPARYWTEDQMIRFREQDYRIVSRLGSGGIGTAFKVIEIDRKTREELGSYVAKAVYDGGEAEGILHAYRLARSHLQRNRNLTQIQEIAREWQEDSFVALMSWIEGTPMYDYIGVFPLLAEEQGETSDQALAVRWLQDVCEALDVLHRNGLVHGDISPRNLIVEGGDLVVTDYDCVTKVGTPYAMPGTVIYSAPGQTQRMPATPSDDLYALAASFFHVLFEREPFRYGGEMDRLRGLHWGDLSQDVYPILAPWLTRATHPDPRQRFVSVSDALAMLHPQVAEIAGEVPADTKRADNDQTQPPPQESGKIPVQPQQNKWLRFALQSYPGSRWGNIETRGLDTPFASQTYVKTPLAACRRKGGFGKVFVEPCRFCVHLDVQGGII
jgi:serine/threonine protein kinase